MRNNRALGFGLLSVLALSTAVAQDDASCTMPGVLVLEDPAGDHTLAPTGEGFADIRTLHMAEPGGGGQLVFSYKMSDLAVLPPSTLWILRFILDTPPANGDLEYFVAMLTSPDAEPHFVHGTAGNADPAGQAGLLFTPEGPLDAQSNFNADGAITLVLDKSKIPGLQPGAAVYGMIPVTHRITPTDGTDPFYYGFRAVGAAQLSYDDGPDGFYEIVGADACGAGKSGLLGGFGGAVSLTTLLLLALGGFAAALGGRRFYSFAK